MSVKFPAIPPGDIAGQFNRDSGVFASRSISWPATGFSAARVVYASQDFGTAFGEEACDFSKPPASRTFGGAAYTFHRSEALGWLLSHVYTLT